MGADSVRRLWLARQGLAAPRGSTPLTPRALTDHLERTGGLQLDPIHVVDRAHYLTLWSRFGPFERADVDRWVYDDRLGYEYWGHEASILPISHLPLGRRRMRGFPSPRTRAAAWWPHYDVPASVKRGVLRRLRAEGPLESGAFERRRGESGTLERRRGESGEPSPVWGVPLPKEARRALRLLWHEGKVAVRTRRHFRCVYDLAERVYPAGPAASRAEYEDSWLLVGLSGNGVASERHLVHYLSAPSPTAAERARILARNLRRKRVVRVEVEGRSGTCYALPEHLDALAQAPEPAGTTLLSPFDSFLWQRERAEDLFGFRYRLEIYVPPSKRELGYYVLPILHEGRLVGRLDPKLHRDARRLEVKRLALEDGVDGGRALAVGLREALEDLMRFVGAEDLALPRGWGARLGTTRRRRKA